MEKRSAPSATSRLCPRTHPAPQESEKGSPVRAFLLHREMFTHKRVSLDFLSWLRWHYRNPGLKSCGGEEKRGVGEKRGRGRGERRGKEEKGEGKGGGEWRRGRGEGKNKVSREKRERRGVKGRR